MRISQEALLVNDGVDTPGEADHGGPDWNQQVDLDFRLKMSSLRPKDTDNNDCAVGDFRHGGGIFKERDGDK